MHATIPKRFYRKFSGHISLTSGNQGNLRKGHCKNEAYIRGLMISFHSLFVLINT